MITSTPSISIVIPTYQEAGYLQKTLNFLLGQSIIGYCEILLVDYDPASTGQTLNIVNSFSAVLPPTRVVRVQQRGIGFARNSGVMQSNSNIICNLDADSHYSDNDGLAKMVNPIVSGQAVMTIPYNYYYDGDPVVDAAVAFSNIIQHVAPFHLTGSCIQKHIIQTAGGFADENTADELGNITRYVNQNGLPLKIVNDTSLIKSARRVKAIVRNPLTTDPNDFGTAYR